ncbi:MAG: DUF1344 domain-containing protein [Sphingomonadales bacterium]
MKTIVSLAVAAVIAAATAGAAHAADIRGRIEKVDAENNIIRLKNGVELSYGDDVNEAELTPGTSIRARYESKKGQFVVTSLKVTSKKD